MLVTVTTPSTLTSKTSRITSGPGGGGGLLRDVLAAYETEPDALPAEPLRAASGRAEAPRDGHTDVGLPRSCR